ncbi:MAG: replication-associated recombination protein A [Candidatus Gracilibacteria bacterium]|nr:replication-associated recombination protein A [Candidatus Gracilibacteria bacterium]
MQPLAHRLRPRSLNDYIGQAHLVSPGKPLYEAIEKGHLFSFLLWGPPGVGKTTLARIYAKAVKGILFEVSAVSAGKEDLKKIVKQATMGQPKILFVDEIHRFNKAQQDYLLPFVETGDLTLIGATTENPSFEVIGALLSRCQVFVLQSHDEEALNTIIDQSELEVPDESRQWLIHYANGDARRLLTILETASQLYPDLSVEHLKSSLSSLSVRYDKKGEGHYDTISAFIKSMRASQPDAALYYLARMLEGGEDPKFIARRMVVFASEDIGMAMPTALVVANEVFRSVETIGLPECGINLAHGVVYLATCKKDRSAYEGFKQALQDIREHGDLPIPMKARNAPTKMMKKMGYGKDYEMYTKESLLPKKLSGKKYV